MRGGGEYEGRRDYIILSLLSIYYMTWLFLAHMYARFFLEYTFGVFDSRTFLLNMIPLFFFFFLFQGLFP